MTFSIKEYAQKLSCPKRIKLTTEILGDQRSGGSHHWLRTVINAKRKIDGKEPLHKNEPYSGEDQTIKSTALLLLISFFEEER